MTAASGLSRTLAAPSPRWPLSALIEVSEAAQKRPAEAPRTTPRRWLVPLVAATTSARVASPADPWHQPRRLVARVGAAAGPLERGGEEREPQGREGDADPLAPRHLVREQAVGGDREQHQAAGDHGLDQRDRRQGEGGDVQRPRARGDDDAERVPARSEQRQRAAHRASHARPSATRPRLGACRGSRAPRRRRWRAPAAARAARRGSSRPGYRAERRRQKAQRTCPRSIRRRSGARRPSRRLTR